MKPIALVTGGNRGIGRSCCKALDLQGFHVVVHYNQGADAASSVASELSDAGTVQADVSTFAGCDALYTHLTKLEGPLRVLVNNAGMVKDSPMFSADPADFDKLMAVNLRSAWYLTKRMVRLMIRGGGGRIINISSVSARAPNPGQSIYGMTKAGLEQMTRIAAVEFAGNGILVNAVSPGFIDTDMTAALSEEVRQSILKTIPIGRMGSPEEVAQAVSFLASSATYITGSVVHVNGGMFGN